MSDTQAQLAEVDALIAASPDDPSLLQLREDLLQLIALEEQERSSGAASGAAQNLDLQNNRSNEQKLGGEEQPEAQHVDGSSEKQNYSTTNYTAQSTFTDNIASNSLAEAPDLGSFQPVTSKSTHKSAATISSPQPAALKSSGEDDDSEKMATGTAAAASATTSEKKKKKKKSSEDDKLLSSKFELPNHLIPLDSDTPAQKQKKQRAAKALKSKFPSKQREMEHTKRANDWKSFSTKASKKNKKLPFVKGLTSKSATEVQVAIHSVLAELNSILGEQVVVRLHTDAGREFVSKAVDEMLSDLKIYSTTTGGCDPKAK